MHRCACLKNLRFDMNLLVLTLCSGSVSHSCMFLCLISLLHSYPVNLCFAYFVLPQLLFFIKCCAFLFCVFLSLCVFSDYTVRIWRDKNLSQEIVTEGNDVIDKSQSVNR